MQIVKKQITVFKLFDNSGNMVEIDYDDVYKVARGLLEMVGLEITNTKSIPPEGDKVIT